MSLIVSDLEILSGQGPSAHQIPGDQHMLFVLWESWSIYI